MKVVPENTRAFLYCMLIAINLALGFRMLMRLSSPQQSPNVLGAVTSLKPPESQAPVAERLLYLINQERAQKNLPPLSASSELEKVANMRASDMVRRNYYAHRDPSGKLYHDYFETDTFKNVYSCENLDLQFTAMPEKYVEDWMTSDKGHRDCLLNPNLTDIGLALAELDTSQDMPKQYIVVAIHAARHGSR